jgi:hypothetical protein
MRPLETAARHTHSTMGRPAMTRTTLRLSRVELSRAGITPAILEGAMQSSVKRLARGFPLLTVYPALKWEIGPSQAGVAAIAKGRGCGVLAATKVNGLGLGGVKLHRRKSASPVGAIAKGLVGAQATGTPEIALAGFNFNGIWTLLCDFRF